MPKPHVLKIGLASIKVCVPKGWDDDEVESFTNGSHMTGLDHGWHIRRQAEYKDDESKERMECERYEGYVHIVLDC